MNVLDTPRAKLFGIPNSLFGICLYTYLIVGLFRFPLLVALFLLTIATARSLYLAYSLFFVTKIPCPLCLIAHAINLTLVLMVLKMTISS